MCVFKIILAWAVVVCVALPCAGAESEPWADGVVAKVISRIEGKVPEAHVPVYREHAAWTLKALKGIGDPTAAEQGLIARLIARYCLDRSQHFMKKSADELRRHLELVRVRYEANLASVTPQMLRTDFQRLRSDLEKDYKTMRGLLCSARLSSLARLNLRLGSQFVTPHASWSFWKRSTGVRSARPANLIIWLYCR